MTNYIRYYKDVAASGALAAAHKELIQPKDCYMNVWRLYCDARILTKKPDWRVAIGAVATNISGLYLKHAFFLNTESAMVIDPTIPLDHSEEMTQRGYYIAAELSSRDYFDRIDKGKGYVDMQNRFFAKQIDALTIWGMQNGIIVAG